MIVNLPAGVPSRTTSAHPPGHVPQQRPEHHQGPGHVDEHLDDVGPDHRGHAAAFGVDHHRHAERDDRRRDRHAGDDGDHQRGREQPDAVGQRSGEEEQAGGDGLDPGSEPPLQQLVRGDQVAAEVGRA